MIRARMLKPCQVERQDRRETPARTESALVKTLTSQRQRPASPDTLCVQNRRHGASRPETTGALVVDGEMRHETNLLLLGHVP